MNKNIRLKAILVGALITTQASLCIHPAPRGHGGYGYRGHGYHGGYGYHGRGYYGRGYYDGSGRWIAPAVLGTAALTAAAASANKPTVVVTQPSNDKEITNLRKHVNNLERENRKLRKEIKSLRRRLDRSRKS